MEIIEIIFFIVKPLYIFVKCVLWIKSWIYDELPEVIESSDSFTECVFQDSENKDEEILNDLVDSVNIQK